MYCHEILGSYIKYLKIMTLTCELVISKKKKKPSCPPKAVLVPDDRKKKKTNMFFNHPLKNHYK